MHDETNDQENKPEYSQPKFVRPDLNTPPVDSTPVRSWDRPTLNLRKVTDVVDKIKAEVSKVIIGQTEMVDLLMAAMFTGGHVLVEGVPGIAKTLTSKLMAQAFHVDYSRIQFTPDLMPTDVVGTTMYNLKTSEFTFNKGPIFSNIVLIDEINRAPAKT